MTLLDCDKINVSQCQHILAETFKGVLSNSYSHFYIMSNEDDNNGCQKQAPKHKSEYVLIYNQVLVKNTQELNKNMMKQMMLVKKCRGHQDNS